MDTPLVVVLSGNPDDEEIAALTVAVLAPAAQRPVAPVLPMPAAWLRSPVHVAPASWAA